MSKSARGLLLPAILTLVCLAILIALGNWQLRRLAWKEALIASVTANIAREPVALPPPDQWNQPAFLDGFAYRPVRLTGRYLPGHTVYAYTVISETKGPLDGPGYWVMDPFGLADGGLVYVNRGFVPFGREGDAKPVDEAETAIFGPLRASEAPNWLTPDPNLETRIWHVRDVAAMAAATGLTGTEAGPLAPFFVDLDQSFTPSSGLPQAGETRVRFANSHLQYAVTWYGLALALAGVFSVFAWRRLFGAPA